MAKGPPTTHTPYIYKIDKTFNDIALVFELG